MTIPAMIVVLVALGATVNTLPPPAPFNAVSWKPTAKARPTTGMKMGSFEVKWEETTLASVVGAAGLGVIQHQGDAGESMYWLCYTIGAKNAQRLWVIAHGEMGGPEHAVTNITAEASRGAKATKACPALPAKLQPVALTQGLWLGASEMNVVKLFGAPSHSQGPWRSLNHASKVPGPCDGGLDVTNWLLYKVHERHLTAIMAGQVTSC